MPMFLAFKTWPLVVAIALGGCATLNEVNQKIDLDPIETAAFASSRALLEARMGRISVLSVAKCFTCGDSVYLSDIATVQRRVFQDYPAELQRQLVASGMLDPGHLSPLDVQLTLKHISHDHTKGAEEQERNPMTNGGELVSSLEIEYRVLRDGQEIFSVPVRSQGATNAVGVLAPPEALNIALNKNLRLFMVALRAGLDADYASTRAPALVKEIVEEKKVSRGVIGDIFVGLAHVGTGAVELLGDTVDVLGSDAFANGVASAGREVRRSSTEMNRRQSEMQYKLAGSPTTVRKGASSGSDSPRSGSGSGSSGGSSSARSGAGASKTAVLELPGAVAVQPVRKPRQLNRKLYTRLDSRPFMEVHSNEGVVEQTADFTAYRVVVDLWPKRGRPVRVPLTYAVRNCMGEVTLDVSVHASEAQWMDYYVRDDEVLSIGTDRLPSDARGLGQVPPSSWPTLDLKATLWQVGFGELQADARNIIEWHSMGKGLVGCVASQTYRLGNLKLKRGDWAKLKGSKVGFSLDKFEPRDARIESVLARLERGDPVPATWND